MPPPPPAVRKEPNVPPTCQHRRRESSLLRMERNRRTLTSAVHTLVSGKEAILNGKKMGAKTRQEIEELSEKLEELLKTTKMEGPIMSIDKTRCSGHCKTIVYKIVEQVRSETEQWSQMKAMLVQVHGEMEKLQESRVYWENRARESEYEIRNLKHDLEEWRQMALTNEIKANELQLELSRCRFELQMSRQELQRSAMKKKGDQDCEEKASAEKELKRGAEEGVTSGHCLLPLSLGKQLSKERRMLIKSSGKQRGSKEKSQKEEFPLQQTLVSSQNSERFRREDRDSSRLDGPLSSKRIESFRMC